MVWAVNEEHSNPLVQTAREYSGIPVTADHRVESCVLATEGWFRGCGWVACVCWIGDFPGRLGWELGRDGPIREAAAGSAPGCSGNG